jgi:O-antigen ligase
VERAATPERSAVVCDPLLAWARGFALAALVLTALLYPLQVLSLAMGAPPPPGTLAAFLRPYFVFEVSPLVLKECLGAMALLICLGHAGTWLLMKRRRQPTVAPAGTRLWLAYLGWALVGLAWSPSFLLDIDCLMSAILLVVWSLAAVALLRLPRPGSFDRKTEWLIIGLGLALMTVSVAQATPHVANHLAKYVNDWAGPFNRNKYGSFIGHNTGVAVACLGPFFLIVGRLVTARGGWPRVGLAAAALLTAYFFFVTKTKFVWVTLPWMVPVYFLGLRKVIGWRIRVRHVAIACGVVVLALLAVGAQLLMAGQSRARAEIEDYVARLRALTPANLQQEGTRPRIFICSLSLVGSSPVVGHGLASFTPLYPPAQADYYTRHPDSRLQPVEAVTIVAHNEYLQTAVESGFVGLGLAGAALFLFLRGGWRRLLAHPDPAERLRRYSALFGIFSIFLSSLMDFPFHIVPIATFFVFYCILYWGPADAAASADPTALLDRIPRAARGIGVAVLWLVVGVLVVYFGRRFQADHHFKRASNLLGAVVGNTPTQQMLYLPDAAREFGLSLEIGGPQFEAYLQKAQAECQMGRLYASAYAGAMDVGNQAAAKDASTTAGKYLTQAREDLLAASHTTRERRGAADRAESPPGVGPRVNHLLYYFLAETTAAELSMKPDDAAGYRDLVALRTLCLRYEPGSPAFATALLGVLGTTDAGQADLRRYALTCMAHFHPEEFLNQELARASSLADSGRTSEARALLEDMRRAAGDPARFPVIIEAMANLQLETGDLEAFDATTAELKQLRPAGDTNVGYLEVCGLLRRGQYAEALARLDGLSPQTGAQGEYWRFARAIATGKMGDPGAADVTARAILRESPDPGLALTMRGLAQLDLFADSKAAVADYAQAIHYQPLTNNMRLALLLLRSEIAAGASAERDETLALLGDGFRRHPAVRQALREAPKGQE